MSGPVVDEYALDNNVPPAISPEITEAQDDSLQLEASSDNISISKPSQMTHGKDLSSINNPQSASELRTLPPIRDLDRTSGTFLNAETALSSPPRSLQTRSVDGQSLGANSTQSGSGSVMASLSVAITSFVKLQDEVTSLRVLAQQKRRALARVRDEVALRYTKISTSIRQSQALGTPLNVEDYASLLAAAEDARNRLGPTEAEFEDIENQLVPKEARLVKSGNAIKRQYTNFNQSDTGRQTPPIPIVFTGQAALDDTVDTDEASTHISFMSSSRPSSPRNVGTENLQLRRASGRDQIGPLESSTPQKTDASIFKALGNKAVPADSLTGRLSSANSELEPPANPSSVDEAFLDQHAPDLRLGQQWSFALNNTSNKDASADPYVETLPELEGFETNFMDQGESKYMNHNQKAPMNSESGSQSPLRHHPDDEIFAKPRNRVRQWLLHQLRTSHWARLIDMIMGDSTWTWAMRECSLVSWEDDDTSFASSRPLSIIGSSVPSEISPHSQMVYESLHNTSTESSMEYSAVSGRRTSLRSRVPIGENFSPSQQLPPTFYLGKPSSRQSFASSAP